MRCSDFSARFLTTFSFSGFYSIYLSVHLTPNYIRAGPAPLLPDSFTRIAISTWPLILSVFGFPVRSILLLDQRPLPAVPVAFRSDMFRQRLYGFIISPRPVSDEGVITFRRRNPVNFRGRRNDLIRFLSFCLVY